MDISWKGKMMKKTIGKKLVYTYLLLIIFTLSVSGTLFYAMIKQFLVTEAMRTLHTEANNLVKVFGSSGVEELPIRRKVLSQIIESDYLIVDKSDQMIVQAGRNIPKGIRFPVELKDVFINGEEMEGMSVFRGEDIVYVALPMYSEKTGQVTRALVLLTDLEQIRSSTQNILFVLLKGFAITLPIMFVIAYVMMRSLMRPLHALRQAVGRLANRDFTPPEIVRSGDELEDLSREFRRMTFALKHYDEAQRRFLQNASHELKTPLMAIQGYAEGIRDGIFRDEEADKGLEVITKESKRLKKIVDELIYLSKLETMDDMYDRKPENLKEIIQECAIGMESIARQKGVHITTQVEECPVLLLDRDKISQAIINLLANGIRHARQTVAIRLSRLPHGIRITIEDDGPGIRDVDMNRIFERFFHGDAGDTGLGLAITRAIIEKSGGTITAGNREEGGAVFAIEFPNI
jgi:signal transduction histidine kinase